MDWLLVMGLAFLILAGVLALAAFGLFLWAIRDAGLALRRVRAILRQAARDTDAATDEVNRVMGQGGP